MDEALDFRLHAPVPEFDPAELVRAHERLSVLQRLGLSLDLRRCLSVSADCAGFLKIADGADGGTVCEILQMC